MHCFVTLVRAGTACTVGRERGTCQNTANGVLQCNTAQLSTQPTTAVTSMPTTLAPATESPVTSAPSLRPTATPTTMSPVVQTTSTPDTTTATFIPLPRIVNAGDVIVSGLAVVADTAASTMRSNAAMRRDFDSALERLVLSFLPVGRIVTSRITSLTAAVGSGRRSTNTAVQFELRIQLSSASEEAAIVGLLQTATTFTIAASVNGFPTSTTVNLCSDCIASLRISTAVPLTTSTSFRVDAGQENSSETNEASSDLAVLIVIAVIILVAIIAAVAFFKYRKTDSSYLSKGSSTSDFLTHTNNAMFDENIASKHREKRRSALAGSDPAASSSFSAARLPYNVSKNRSLDRLPYNQTRVFLAHNNGPPGADYINASLITLRGDNKYIAAQGPLGTTVNDFWRMIMQQKCTVIVAMTTEASDAAPYWPEQGSIRYGDVSVSLESEVVHTGYIVRHLSVSMSGTSRDIMHFQYLDWPDESEGHDIDTSTFLAMRREILQHEDISVPTLVHCATGCGRTAVYLCADSELKHFREKSRADIHEAVVTARHSRAIMVETWLQYVYLHSIVVEAVMHEPAYPTKTVPEDVADFIRKIRVPPLMRAEWPSFDLGIPGRMIHSIGSFSCALNRRSRGGKAKRSPAPSAPNQPIIKIAVCTDIIIAARVTYDGMYELDSISPRATITVSSSGTNSIKFHGTRDYTLKCVNEAERAQWLANLSSLDGFTPTDTMNGRRIASYRPNFRRDALTVLAIQDPRTESGIIDLKSEYTNIPKTLQSQNSRGSAWHQDIQPLPSPRQDLNNSYLSVGNVTHNSIFAYPSPIASPAAVHSTPHHSHPGYRNFMTPAAR